MIHCFSFCLLDLITLSPVTFVLHTLICIMTCGQLGYRLNIKVFFSPPEWLIEVWLVCFIFFCAVLWDLPSPSGLDPTPRTWLREMWQSQQVRVLSKIVILHEVKAKYYVKHHFWQILVVFFVVICTHPCIYFSEGNNQFNRSFSNCTVAEKTFLESEMGLKVLQSGVGEVCANFNTFSVRSPAFTF